MAKTPFCTPKKAKERERCISDFKKSHKKGNPWAICTRSINCHPRHRG